MSLLEYEHAIKAGNGWTDEDHLSAVFCGAKMKVVDVRITEETIFIDLEEAK